MRGNRFFWPSQHSCFQMSERRDIFGAKSAHIHGLLLSGNVIIAIIARPLSLTDSLPTASVHQSFLRRVRVLSHNIQNELDAI